MTGLLTEIVGLGASVIIRPAGWPSHDSNPLNKWMGIAIEYKGLRHGITCDDLQDGLERAREWLLIFKYYEGVQWTAEDCKAMEARSA